jgi:PPM family protein phosphatase
LSEKGAAQHAPPLLELAAVSHAGTVRVENEDCCAAILDESGAGVIVVADGVSSYPGGDTASRTAVDVLLRTLAEQPKTVTPTKRLHRAVQRANIAVYDLSVVVPELIGMATTLTAVLVDGPRAVAMHVGDCRLYRARRGELVQLTKDHTVFAERAKLGLARSSQRKDDPNRSILTRSLGRELIAAVDQLSMRVEQGDTLVVCSDGLYNVVDEPIMARGCGDGATTLEVCQELVDEAIRRGAADNVTVAALRVVGNLPPEATPSGFEGLLRRFFGAS